jgi:Rad3-related DNA helicase
MVHRGKYSEGFNFKDDLCRGIFMVGVPNKNIREPKIIMKEIFYQKFSNLLKTSGNVELDHFGKYYAR